MAIDRSEMKRILDQDQDTLVINVLDRASYEAGHIPGSINVPFDEPGFVEAVARQATGRHQPIVLYCASADCPTSGLAAERLREAGFVAVRVYDGGLAEWSAGGHPVVSGATAL